MLNSIKERAIEIIKKFGFDENDTGEYNMLNIIEHIYEDDVLGILSGKGLIYEENITLREMAIRYIDIIKEAEDDLPYLRIDTMVDMLKSCDYHEIRANNTVYAIY